MADNVVYIPSPDGAAGSYVELAKTDENRIMRKQILPMNGSFVHPADKSTKIFVDRTMAQSLVDNFNKGYCPIVQVPVVNDKNQHVEDPLRNAGRVIDVDYDDTGVYATMKISKWAEDFGDTILGASAFLHLNYENTANGEKVGPTLLHVAATNRPYVTGLKDFEEIIKASADISDEQPIFLTPEDAAETPPPAVEPQDAPTTEVTPVVEENGSQTIEEEDRTMTSEEMKAALEAEGFKVVPATELESLETEAAKAAELSGQLAAVNEQIALSGDSTIDINDLATALVELSNSDKEKAARIESLELSNQQFAQKAAADEVDTLVRQGRVLPKQRDAFVELALSNRDQFDALVPDKSVVSLSEVGVTVHESPDELSAKEERMARYKSMATAIGSRK